MKSIWMRYDRIFSKSLLRKGPFSGKIDFHLPLLTLNRRFAVRFG